MCGGVYFVRVGGRSLVGGRGLVRGMSLVRRRLLGEGVSWGGFSSGRSFALTSLFLRLGAVLGPRMGLVGKIDLRDWFCNTGFQCFRMYTRPQTPLHLETPHYAQHIESLLK